MNRTGPEAAVKRPWWMPLSRPCYDKFHRCPGRNGGGPRYAKVIYCERGYLGAHYEKRLWKWRFARCPECRVLVLPYHSKKLSAIWQIGQARGWLENRRYEKGFR